MNVEMYNHLLKTIKSLRESLHEKLDEQHAILNEIEKTVTESARPKSRAKSWQEWEVNQERTTNYD